MKLTAKIMLLAASLGSLAATMEAQVIRAGFDSNTLAANDDGSTNAVSLPFTIDFFGVDYAQTYINNNGNITFDNSLSTFTPFGLLSTNTPIIAPFFADVDTRDGTSGGVPGIVEYGTGTVDGRTAFGVNWPAVEPYFYGDYSDVFNSFQLVLIDRSDTGAGNFDIEFNYGSIEWDTGDASSVSAVVGYSNGIDTAFQLAGSLDSGAFLDNGPNALIRGTNINMPGRYLFEARNGQVTVNPVPEPSVYAGLALAVAMGLVVIRRKRRQA